MKQRILIVLTMVFCAAGCAPVYVPNVRNTPLFTKAGEFQGHVMYGTADLDVQTAVAVTNNIALMGNFSYGNRNTDSLNQSDYHKHQFAEGAIGYFKNDKNFCFEIFLGYGQGNASSFGYYPFFGTGDHMAYGKFSRVFLQPAFGFNKKVVNVSFSPRFSLVDFSEFRTTYNTTVLDLSPKVFFEPAVTTRFNFLDNRFYGILQVGISTPINGEVIFDYEGFNFSTGMGFRLGGLRWSANEKKQ